ncbi:YybH family protein [Endozoicomonadaceae bacterium StTr2]
MNHSILLEALKASQNWVKHFNKGDVDYCVAGYLHDAEVKVKPLGDFSGAKSIDGLWRPFIESGASNLEYSEIWLKQQDKKTVQLGANWSMNIGRGVITLEEWVKQPDGVWKLARDQFEITEQF